MNAQLLGIVFSMRKNRKGFGTVEAIVIVLIVGVLGLICWYTLNRDSRPNAVTLRISSATSKYSTGQYVRINMLARNDTGKPQDFAWQNCVESLNYWVDGKQKDQFSNASCLLGVAPMPAGQTLSRTDTYDPSTLDAGKHTLQISVNGVKSNILTLAIVRNEQSIPDCYSYTHDVTPLCRAIKITTGAWSIEPSENNSECLNVKRQFLANTRLQPIPSLSTIDCSHGKTAYFVANVPPADLKSLLAMLNTRVDTTMVVSSGFPSELNYPKL